jgi:tetratricopeptide (TPR) repeat protein
MALSYCVAYANDKPKSKNHNTNVVTKSQADILYDYKILSKKQVKQNLKILFNKGVLFLEKKEYKKAIEIFDKTKEVFVLPSLLNMATSYYELKEYDKSKETLDILYGYAVLKKNYYIYFGTNFYYYKVTKDKKYLKATINHYEKNKKIAFSDLEINIIVDSYILNGSYQKAYDTLKKTAMPSQLKLAVLMIKLRKYAKAQAHLNDAKTLTFDDKYRDKILWINLYKEIKSNNIKNIQNIIDLIEQRGMEFETNLELPIKLEFNKNKLSQKDYRAGLDKFSFATEVDIVFYFAPFIFSNNEILEFESTKSFATKDTKNIDNLDTIVSYNQTFLKYSKYDPIIRTQKLQSMINRSSRSYEYYNLALSYTHIFAYNKAYDYFKKAFNLNPGNKLFASFMILSAKRANIKIDDKDMEFVKSSMNNPKGDFNFIGKFVYQTMISKSYTIVAKDFDENNILFKALSYLIKKRENRLTKYEPLFLQKDTKDPLIFLLKTLVKTKDEDEFDYIANVQNIIPTKLNNTYLSGALLITDMYIKILHAFGMYDNSVLSTTATTPTYLRTKAYQELYSGHPKIAIDILEDLQAKYELEDKNSLYLQVASFLELKQYNDASITIELIKAILSDNDSKFLTAVLLLQERKFVNASRNFVEPYNDNIIDFKMQNLDKFLLSL